MKRAPFLSLDGIDGTGKSTQCRLLVESLNANGFPAIGCADPGGTPVTGALSGSNPCHGMCIPTPRARRC